MGLKKGGGFSRSSINTGVGYAILAGSNMGEQMVSAVGPEGDVWILATRQEEGEPVERAFRYKSVEEMKEKNAELHKLYERFKSGGRPRAIPGLGLKGGGIPLPADAGAALERHKEMMLKMEARMEEARARAEELRKRAEEARKPKPKKEDWVDKPI